ncbi:rhodanese-like domain-containing protein [Rickettsiales bacterium]|nr:rhodanese-like domain-containing protein [Rickettsiales bacterium]
MSKIKLIKAADLNELLRKKECALIDVREDAEYAEEHIEGSILNPLSRLNLELVKSIKDKQIIFMCKAGIRSEQACKAWLQYSDANEAIHLEDGIYGWKSSGLPIKSS